MINYKSIRTGNNCIIWTRVQTKPQEENGASLDDQKTKCEEYARQKSLNIVGYYVGTHFPLSRYNIIDRFTAGCIKKTEEKPFDFSSVVNWCGWRDSNSHRITPTTPSK